MNAKLIFFCGLCFFYASPLTFGATIEFDDAPMANNSERTQRNVETKRLTFLHLIEDVQVLIVEKLDINDLLSLAEAINTRLFAIEFVFQHRYKEKIVRVQDIQDDSVSPLFDRDMIYVMGYPAFSRLLNVFGHLINGLELYLNWVSNESGENKIPIILQLINAQCSKSLTAFRIYNLDNFTNTFTEFKAPFEQVRYVVLGGMFDSFSGSNLAFDEIFPRVNHLETSPHFSLEDKSSLVAHYPHLETFSTRVSSEDGKIDADFCEKLVQSNPQMRKIEIGFQFQFEMNGIEMARSVLRTLANGLPHLEFLKLNNYKDDEHDNEQIHFANLKVLIMSRGSERSLPAQVSFDNLEEFTTGSFNTFCNRWLHLVKTQNTLKVLKVERDLTLTEFAQLANASLSLVEMEINCPSTNFNVEEFAPKMRHVVQIIEKSMQLQKLILPVGYENINMVLDSLQNQLSNKWVVTNSSVENEQFVYVKRMGDE